MRDLWTDTGGRRKDSHEPFVPKAKMTMFPYKPSREVSMELSVWCHHSRSLHTLGTDRNSICKQRLGSLTLHTSSRLMIFGKYLKLKCLFLLISFLKKKV